MNNLKEDKELLLKDLCGRLPYGVKFRYKYIDECFREKYGTSILNGVVPPYHIIHSTLVGKEYLKIEEDEVKPYLFPLSSMTEEQKYICPIGVGNLETFIEKESWAYLELSFDSIIRFIDWLNKNHFDYRGLIPMGLAIDCTNLNIY